MSVAVRGTTCVAPGQLHMDAPSSSPVCARLHRFLFVEDRTAVHDHRVRPRESGWPIHKKQLLPVLVVWGPPRKKRNQEQHALNGSTSPSAAVSPPRSVRQRVDLANDDDLEPTLVLPATAPGAAADGPGRPHTDLEARLERLLTRGRELVGTLTRHEVDILERRGHRSAQTAHSDDGSRLPQQARYRASRTGRARCVQSDTIELHAGRGVNILWAPEGGLHIPAHNGVLFTSHWFSWRTFELVFSSSALRRIKAKMVALEGLFRKLGGARP